MSRANAFLTAAYWPEHNRRFAVAPAAADDFHRRVPPRVSLDDVFRLEEKRTVSNDWVVRYANRHFPLERQSQQPPARSTVQVFETPDGTIEIQYRERRMRWTEIPRPAPPVTAAPARPSVDHTLGRQPSRFGQSADHPWRQAGGEHALYRQAARDRRAWERVQP